MAVDNKTKKYSASTALLGQYINAFTGENERVNLTGIKFDKLLFSNELLREIPQITFDDAHFTNCKFENWSLQNPSFRKCKFIDTTFINMHFCGNSCTFEDAEFDCNSTIFDHCQFDLSQEDMDHSSVKFDGGSIRTERHLFSSSIIRAKKLTMSECELDCKYMHIIVGSSNFTSVYLSTLTLSGPAIIFLSGFRYYGALHLNQFLENIEFVPSIYLTNINFSKMAYVHFLRINLEETWFTHSEIESVKFRSCTWKEKNGYKLLREDEVDDASLVKYPEEMIRLYTELKKNFESSRDFIGAGDWFYREMEARRRAAIEQISDGHGSIKERVHLLAIRTYKGISNYGENYFRPLLWLVSVLFLSAFSYMLNGFVLGNQEKVDYSFAIVNPITIQHFQDFLKALLASISAMALQVGKVVEFSSPGSITTFIFQFIITAILLSFFLLALRRKFRR